jgi:inorganic pyrophosphatase
VNIESFNEFGELNIIVETPKGSRNKYKYDEKVHLFKLHKLLPTGTVFPFDFGFVPCTRAPDGDPLDVLVLMDEPVAVGCLVPVRLIGVVEAKQTQDGKTSRNDRLIGIATTSRMYQDVRSLSGLNAALLTEVEKFFVFYNSLQGRTFKVLGRHGTARALKTVHAGKAEFERAAKASARKDGNQ